MTAHFYLIVSRSGAERITKTLPRLQPGEIVIRLTLEVPNTLFEARQIQAAITIPERMVPTEPLSAEVQDNVRDLIEQATGLDVRLIVETAPPAE